MSTPALPALAILFAVVATPAPCQPQAASIGDWRRGVGCVALMEKLAFENERGVASLSAAMRKDPKMAEELPRMQKEQGDAIAVKRALVKTMIRNTDAMLAANYQTWGHDASLPAAAELARREKAEATRVAARPNNLKALMKAIDDQHCEDFMVGDR
jgi:hypothetical protein